MIYLATKITILARYDDASMNIPPQSDSASCPRFTFILQPEFPLNALILASDALRIANQNSGHDLFEWLFVSETGEPVRASNGMWFDVDCALHDMSAAEVYLLFEGNLPTQRNSPTLLGSLRAAARFRGRRRGRRYRRLRPRPSRRHRD